MGDVEPKRPLSRLLFVGYVFSAMGLMLTLTGTSPTGTAFPLRAS